ncbi:hypothetical protein [Bradyrhizobium commune]|uniref:Asparagine synthetase domain-containing protein n=1 Tax=Bradyrhizobium commune TaxID=83627 RepID=A0A7S9D6X2_9BRAD|nr:hypothetical protein [Bradyrhizobium commune]QPF92315.1 hypothetical protein IC761_03155 [Bradyrhizobium commune]
MMDWSVLPAMRLEAGCAVMFSGGRDSTIAAARLSQAGTTTFLITISSGHLVGIQRVRQRIREMNAILPPSTRWLHVKQPMALKTDTSFYEKTCLPCHHSYVVASSVLAARLKIPNLAFGYASYQSSWPEQSPIAITRLSSILARHGIKLVLPAYDLISREEAEKTLQKLGLSSESLEQKCLQQVSNVSLSDDILRQQVDLWGSAIDASISKLSEIEVEVLEDTMIENV